ncbi:hypothetical protein BB560_007213 [Smittium megazygosporum]|uniref:Dynamin GTPase n=1 Tax=Smittium megazygosporum TaxID=133381 RepID=A0A2T9XXX5_9FUNG|nr:hypothetical protein BB560_007213 [Smittium megazygosporum]
MESLIETVNKLQDIFTTIGQDPIDLPQIVVVGSQSSGKSSVLENLVGFDFLPRGNGIVTRRPLVLQLINVPPSQDQDTDSNSSSVSPTEYAQFLHYPSKKFTDMNEVKNEIQAETERLAGKNKGIVRVPINLKIFSSKVLNLTLIDLPGLTKIPVGDQPTDIDIQIKQLVMEYISKPNSIILAVSPANVDLANSESLKVAREVDPEHKRTLGVLTKLDLMDKGTSAVDILTGRVYPLRLGFTGVVCRSQEETDSNKSIAEALVSEKQFFENHPLYRSIKQHCGSQNLAIVTKSLLASHIKEKLPEIKSKIDSLISSTEYELESFGIISETPQKNNLARLLKLITQFSTNFTNSVEGTWAELPTDQLSGGARLYYIFHQIFSAGLEKINPIVNLSDNDIRTAIRNSSGPRGSLFVPELSFQLLIKPLIKSLESPSQRCVQLAYEELLQIANSCDSNELRRFPKLHQKVMSVASELLRECVQPTSEYVESIIAVERAYINTNHPDFIGGAGALAELQRKADIKKREAAKQILRASNKYGFSSTNHRDSMNIDSDISNIYDNIPSPDLSEFEEENPDPQSKNTEKVAIDSEGSAPNQLADRFSNGLNLDRDRIELSASRQSDTPSFYKSFFANASDKLMGKNIPNPYRKSSIENKQYSSAFYNEETPLSNQLELPIANRINDPNLSGSTINHRAHFITRKLGERLSADERDELEIMLIRLLISSYFNIVKKTVMDLVPKTIMHYLVNQTCESLQNSLVESLYSESFAEDLMQEDPELLKEYNRCKSMLEIYKRSYKIISEIL